MSLRDANLNPRIASSPEHAACLVALDGAAIVRDVASVDAAVEFGAAMLAERLVRIAPQIEATRAVAEADGAIVAAQPVDERGRKRLYSSFDQVQPAHNDGYGFGDFAPDHIFLWCDVPCSKGGASFLVDAAEVLAAAGGDDPSFARFASIVAVDHSEPNFPQHHDVPIARITAGGRLQVRAHPYQCAARGPDEVADQRMVERWHAAVQEARDEGIRFRLRSGDLLCIDNYRMLHGRDAYVEPARRVVSIWSWSTSAVAVPGESLEIVTPTVPAAPAQRGS